jgi:mono/diheme cytochrome c family protein
LKAARLIFLLLGTSLLGACEKEPAPPHVKTGEQLYNYYCAECHQGSGDGTFLKGVPPVRYTNLTYRELAHLILGHSRADSSRMPEFEISKQQADAIAIYVRRRLRAD